MTEDEFEVNGRTYIAVDAKSVECTPTCGWCAFRSFRYALHCAKLKCTANQRIDGRDVIFVEKQND